MSYNGYFYSPYYQQQQQQPSNHTPTSYAQQTNTGAAQYQTNQLPSIDQSHTQATPVSRSYDASTYSTYDSYSRTDARSDQAQRAGSRSDYSNHTPTSRVEDGSGYGNSGYATGITRNNSPITEGGERRPQATPNSRESYGSIGGGYSTSYSRNDYTSQKADGQATTSTYQYPSTYASTNIAHAAPYSQASQNQSSRGHSVRSPLTHSANYDAPHPQPAQQSEDTTRSYQRPSIDKSAQEHQRADSGGHTSRSTQSTRTSNLPPYTSQAATQHVPQSIPTPEPRTQTPQQIYREDRTNPRQVPVTSQDKAVSGSKENRKTQESQAPKKSRPQKPQPVKTKTSLSASASASASSKAARSNASNMAGSSRVASNSAATLSQHSPTDYASQSPSIVQDEPATVDPSQVFNQQEYQRRKDAIDADSRAAKEAAERAQANARKAKEEAAREAEEQKVKEAAVQKAADEAKRRAAAKRKEKENEGTQKVREEEEEARKRRARIEEDAHKKRARVEDEVLRKKAAAATGASSSASTTATPQSRAPLPAQTVEGIAASPASPTLAKDSPHADAIKTLFGSMFGQMRELKAKDPTLFSEVWEDFKKNQPPIGGRASSQRPSAIQGPPHATANVASPTLQSPSMLDNDALPNLSAALDSPSFGSATQQEIGTADRGRFPAQRRKRRTKADIVAARAGSTESSRVDLARDDAVAGLTKLQQAKASESSQGEKVGAAKTSTPGTQSSPAATLPPAPPNSQAQSSTAGQAASNSIDVAMQEAMRTFHYPNPGSANQPVQAYQPYTHISYPTYSAANVPTASQLRVQETHNTLQAYDNAGQRTAQTPQPLSAQPPNPNLAHLSYANSTFASHSSAASNQPTGRATVWPKGSRAAIATAARDTLMANPQNAGKPITTETLIGMLDKDPSYLELCDILEKKMYFSLDRRHFAHSLLQAVPTGKPATNNLEETKALQQQMAPTPSTASGSIKRESMSKSKQKKPLPSPTEPTGTTPPAEQGPTSKAEMARKRTFADVVDLTTASDEEGDIKRAKLTQLNNEQTGSGSSRDPSRVRNDEIPSHPLLAPPVSKESERLDMSNLKNFTLSAAREALRTAEIARQIDKSEAIPVDQYNVKTLARDILITAGKHETEAPLNFHLFGLRSIYKHINLNTDLSTLRWDIMDPGGPEPGTGAGLEDLANGAGGMGNGLGEEVDTDVVARSVQKSKGKSKEKEKGKGVGKARQTTDTETEDDARPAPIFEPVPRRMIPTRGRGRPRGSGRLSRGVDRAHVAAHKALAAAPPKSNHRDLVPPTPPTIDLVSSAAPTNNFVPPARGTFSRFSLQHKHSSPEKPSQQKLAHQNSSPLASPQGARSKHFPPASPHSPSKAKLSMPPALSSSTNKIDQLFSTPSTQRASEIRRSSLAKDVSSADAGTASPTGWQTSQTTPSGLTVRVPSGTPGSSGNRRGRPPGSLNKPKDQAATPKRRGRPLGSINKPSGLRKSHVPPEDGLRVYVEPSEMKEDEGKAVMIYRDSDDDYEDGTAADIRDLANSDAGSETRDRSSSKRAKHWNQPSPPPPSEPVYQVYVCQWQGCAAQLHNLETLRKHVFKLHWKEGNCRWDGCEGLIGIEAGEEGGEIYQRLRGHLEVEHLQPLAWNLGDGPRVEKGEGRGSDGERERSAGVTVIERANL